MRSEFAVTIDGKELTGVLNLNAFRLLSQRFKVGLSELDTWLGQNPLEALPALAYCGVINRAVREGVPGPGEFELFAARFFDVEENITAVSEGIENAFGPQDEDAGKE